jgi:ribosomal protein S18 acetylase RimI-like enzyme
VFVSEIDNNIVGFVAIDKRDAYTVKLTHVYVSGGFRGAGIGEALCRAAIESLNTGVEIGVLVSATNAAALALFQKLGFALPFGGEKYQNCGEYVHLSLRIV